MNLVVLGIIAGVVLLPLLRALDLHRRVSAYASRLLVALAFIVIFLVGMLAGGAIRSPSLALRVVSLSLAMSVVGISSSLLAASLLLKQYMRSKQMGKELLRDKELNGTFTPLRALVVMALGWALGFSSPSLSEGVLEQALYYLVFVLVFVAVLSVAAEIDMVARDTRLLGLGVLLGASTMLSSGLAFLVFYPLTHMEPRVLAAIGAASGWYSLVGPLLASINPVYGTIGFLTNLFRESLHILLYPLVSLRGLALPGVAMGGATSMDTGLPVIAIYGDRDSLITGMVQGIVITLVAPIVLSLLVPT